MEIEYKPTQIAAIPVIPPHEKYCKTSYCTCAALQEAYGERAEEYKYCRLFNEELDWQKVRGVDGGVFYTAIRRNECLESEGEIAGVEND